MRLRQQELAGHLAGRLLPIYLLSGDEPLQLTEAADAVRQAARERGHTVREVLEVDKGFEWGRLGAEADALSLFAERRLIELRMPGGKPGTQGGAAITEYARRPPEDTVLLISMPKFDRDQGRAAWVKAVETAGAVIQVWPIEPDRLPGWVGQRMRRRGLDPGPGVAELLAGRVEGNLLACAQEIEKLLLLHGPGRLTAEQLAEAVADSARFDVYALADSALQGNAGRSLRILRGLRAEGTPAPLVLWALARELRAIAAVAAAMEGGGSPDQAMAAHGVWDKRRAPVQQAARRQPARAWREVLCTCARCDGAIKGQESAEPWLLLEDIALAMSGAAPWPTARCRA
ncbi:MAG: DNA polymerase III subunit delta [Gammaproteobacteria bacterium]|jgi:DNA polymerase-3 subunit delta|nr:DNA polymerase III subunit delta [Gammaproteobacteria bacterium]